MWFSRVIRIHQIRARLEAFGLLGVIVKYVLNYLLLTAGKAKKEMPKRAPREAMILPFHDFGTASPYPTVQSVICKKSG